MSANTIKSILSLPNIVLYSGCIRWTEKRLILCDISTAIRSHKRSEMIGLKPEMFTIYLNSKSTIQLYTLVLLLFQFLLVNHYYNDNNSIRFDSHLFIFDKCIIYSSVNVICLPKKGI